MVELGRRLRGHKRLFTTVLGVLLLLNVWVGWLTLFGVTLDVPVRTAQIAPRSGHGYAYRLPERKLWRIRGDSREHHRHAESQLYEDGEPIGPAHVLHTAIDSFGNGQYSHWQENLFFSSSDNSDPRTNGRRYSLVCRARLAPAYLMISALPLLPFLLVGLGRLALALYPRQDAPSDGVPEIPPSRLGLRALTWAGVMAVGIVAAAFAAKVFFWLAVTLILMGAVYVAANLLRAGLALIGRKSRFCVSHPLAFSLLSVMVFTMLFEVTLGYLERSVSGSRRKARSAARPSAESTGEPVSVPLLHPEAAAAKASRSGALTLPEAWERRPVKVPGTSSAYYWHEALHVHDQHQFRRSTPFPPKADDVFRIVVVGDSITYGQGVEEKWIYPSLIEEQLAKDYRVEVLNLGVSGDQSSDILQVVKNFVPLLRPDLVIYGVCHNDFLPSGLGQYRKEYLFPMPESWKRFFLQRTRVAHFVEESYDVLTRALDLRVDFYDDILRDFAGYQARFARDVKEMNAFVRSRGLPAVIGIVLDQAPVVSSRSHEVTRTAERHLEKAGMTVIGTEDYYRRFDGRRFRVSRWEGHPDEEAHAIFAGMILDQIRSQVDLESLRRAP